MSDLAIDAIRGIQPYQAGKPVEELERELGITSAIKLASNENPWGCSPLAVENIQAALNDLSLYPDANAFYLKQALAKKLNVAEDQITIGNGSNDVLDLLARTFLTVGDEAVYSEYAFLVYPLVVQAVGASAQVAKALSADNEQPYGHDLDAMLELITPKTKIIFLANPNNPTGTWFEKKALDAFIQQVPPHVIVVIDEAYCEYVTESDYPDGLDYVAKYDNVVVTRTFSKVYGLAALRIGYAISHQSVANVLNRVRQPFNANSLGLVAALASVDDDAFVAQCAKNNRLALNDFECFLKAKNCSFIPSAGNFLMVDFADKTQRINTLLLEQGIIVRPVANYGLNQFLRISMGTQSQMARLKTALSDILEYMND